MLKIRLTRTGKKHQPSYRVVVTPKENPVKGKYLTSLGHYDPVREEISIDSEKVLAWLNKGAQPSQRIARLLDKAGVKHKSITVIHYHTKPKQAKEAKEVASPEPVEVTDEAAEEATVPTSDEAPAQGEQEQLPSQG